MTTDTELTKGQEVMFQPGCFVVLHPDSKHPDAGRVGKSEFSTILFGHWLSVGDFQVEEYEPRAKKRGWRVTVRGMKMFRDLGWGYTAAMEGKV